MFAGRLCDLCDDNHILLDSDAHEFFTENYEKETIEKFGFEITNKRFLQDLENFCKK
jgi:transketolase